MKNLKIGRFTLRLVYLVFCIGLIASPCSGDTAIKNVLENGGLEGELDPATGLPAGWEVTQMPANAYKVEVVAGGRTGKKCLRISGEGGSVRVRLKHLPMNPDQRSVISGWIKGADGGGVVSLMHRYVDPSGRGLNSTSIGGVKSVAGDWIHTAMIEHPEYTRPGAEADFIISGNGKINALVDDLQVFTLAVTPDDLLLAAGEFESHYSGRLPPIHKTATSPGGTLEMSLSDNNPANGQYCLRMKGNAEWSTTTLRPVQYEPGKVYSLTGKVRVNKGRASLRIDYYKDEKRTDWLGSSAAKSIESKDWQELSVNTSENTHAATHIAVTAVCHDDADAFFDQFVLLAK